jgi:hypothetical protein
MDEVGSIGEPGGGRQARTVGRVVDELIELKFHPDLLRGFIRQTGLPGVSVAA